VSSQKKLWKSSFLDFIGSKDSFCVVRILTTPNIIHKDEKVSKELETKEEAIKYFNEIKNDYVAGFEVLTSIFKGTKIDDVYWKIKDCSKKEELKLNL
jgi:hypothetical protein